MLIGMVVYFNESIAKIYFFIALTFFLYRVVVAPNNKKTFEILKACAYFVGAEVFFRMTKGSISYEAGKYLVIFFMLLGMFYKGISGKGYPYFLYILLLIPSIFVASTTLSFDANFRTNIAFVLSGPICLGIAALFCYDKRISMKQLNTLLLYVVLPIITHTVYIFFYNPTVRDVLSGTGSNRAASGGWGANQISTVLGLGMFIIAVRLFTKSPNFGLKILNVILFSAISFRAIVTFSRGGVITAIATIIAFLVIYYAKVNRKKKNEIIALGALFIVSMVSVWIISSKQTDGYIDLRYANKDHLGREKGDITTGRKKLFQEELEGFISNPFFGIGSSRAKDQRIEVEGQGVTSHSEISRLLAEHGLLGVMIIVILLFKPIDLRSWNRRNIFFYAFLCFWFATVNHSSMRIAAPAFIYALTLLNVTYDKRPLHRKQAAQLKA
ncbi:MAG: O-antigen ligase family protein [Psychroserpens sp.]|nr:O-antigen ligase family protein [Psychroserpens sp.]MBO6654120.1 O-antigen ligase family protein [Psychroserpens sp.]MBO6682594.1 O-antigen ligase family protein [Psychroserpens sp.]MBO6750746.1 O-antigen ligase family protein [Psychroserpens sp.]MBO6915825.1 O-antigen ligase family protein [Psychroserpens sp.]